MTAKEAKELALKHHPDFTSEVERVCQAVYADVRKASLEGRTFCLLPAYKDAPDMDGRLRKMVEERLKSEGYVIVAFNRSFADGGLGPISWE